ncbi:XamI family restriction endonuclease [Mesorhizobium sp. PUT5]|uniref:XamI family restriction endonuclease n=1 Tax=Mesorhizobium sp. PUT5 TaxID=3454629 RepID=UPI003FA4AFC1
MTLPTKWTSQQLADDCLESVRAFRRERLDEPLELYSEHFENFSRVFAGVVDQIPDIKADPVNVDVLADLMRDDDTRRALCYLTAPPISEDDLKTLVDASIRPTPLRADPASAARLRDVIIRILDPHRFPWVDAGRAPTPDERAAAILASAALVAARKVETFRRNDAKDRQEENVKQLLRDFGYTEVPKHDIPNASVAPAIGTFMGETPLAGAKADVVTRLADGRIMAIECKVSNSSVNSYKRLVHDTGGKATIWYSQLGRANLVPCAVLNGVFSVANCETVQNDKDVYLFWDHRLNDLRDFIASIT